MRIRYVDGSDVLPRGRHVGVAPGDGEVVIMLNMQAPPSVLLQAMSETVSEHASTHWLYVGEVEIAHVS